jgi:hypothetical protein
MNHQPSFPERIRRAFEPTQTGVVGLVDNLLDLCREQGLQLGWHGNRCHVRPLGAGPQESAELPLPKSVFRAILARLATLCNEQSPGSVSPYGGEGELSVGTSPRMVYRVAFTNTRGEQGLELSLSAEGKSGATGDVAIEAVSQIPEQRSSNRLGRSSRSSAR